MHYPNVRAKWNAWNQLTLSQEEAEKSYIDLVNDLVKADSKK
jgi:acyl-CoA-binding protein